jgi:hypothetical protein
MIIMQSQIPYSTYTVSSGNVYVADQYGIIPNVVTVADQHDLETAGCATLAPNPTDLLGYLIQADFNIITDQLISNLNNSYKYRIRRITVCNTTVNGMSVSAGGFYTGAAKTGTIIVANTQVYTGLTNAATALDLTLNSPNAVLPAATPLYFSLTTGHGSAAKADIYVYGDAIPVS